MPSFAKCLVYLLSFHPHNNSRSQDIVKPRILLTLFYVETSKAQSQICADWFLSLYLQLLSELGHLAPTVCPARAPALQTQPEPRDRSWPAGHSPPRPPPSHWAFLSRTFWTSSQTFSVEWHQNTLYLGACRLLGISHLGIHQTMIWILLAVLLWESVLASLNLCLASCKTGMIILLISQGYYLRRLWGGHGWGGGYGPDDVGPCRPHQGVRLCPEHFVFLILFWAARWGVWDLHFPTRDWTMPPEVEALNHFEALKPLNYQGSPLSTLKIHWPVWRGKVMWWDVRF